MDMEGKILQYNDKRKAGLQKIQIYGFGWQDFEKIYVIPAMGKKDQRRYSYPNANRDRVRLIAPLRESTEDPGPTLFIGIGGTGSLNVSRLASEIESAQRDFAERILCIGSPCESETSDKTGDHVSMQKYLQEHPNGKWIMDAVGDETAKGWALLRKIRNLTDKSFHAADDMEEERKKTLRNFFCLPQDQPGSDVVYLIGGPGYGKSLFLRLLCICPEYLRDFSQKPLLILHGDLKAMIREDGSRIGLLDFLSSSLSHCALTSGTSEERAFVEECLRAGRCLVLLDALDEVKTEQREELHDLILHTFEHDYPGNKVCITSRDRGFIQREGICCYHLKPVSPWDIVEYVRRVTEAGGEDTLPIDGIQGFLSEAVELVEKGFIKGFLTLSLLLAIYKENEELPKNKFQLYEKCFEYMARRREKEKDYLRNKRTGENYNWDYLDVLLTEESFMTLARMGTPNNKDIPVRQIKNRFFELYRKEFQGTTSCKEAADEFLLFCAERTEVFVPSAHTNNSYRFFHRSFYEYFYVRALDEMSFDPKKILEEIRYFGLDSEVFELLSLLYRLNERMDDLEALCRILAEKARKEWTAPSSEKRKLTCTEVLILLLAPFRDGFFHKEFTNLILDRIGASDLGISKIPLSVVTEILSADPDYVQKAVAKKNIRLSRFLKRQIVHACFGKDGRKSIRDLKNQLYSGSSRVDLASTMTFAVPEILVETLKGGYAQYEEALLELQDELVARKRGLDEKQSRELRAFVLGIMDHPPVKRVEIYQKMLFLSRENA